MSIRKKVSFLFMVLVVIILIIHNVVHYIWMRDALLQEQRRKMQLVSETVSYQIKQAKEGSLYVEGLIGLHLRTAAIAAQKALPPVAKDITSEQLQHLSKELLVDHITLFQPTAGGKEIIGVQSSDPHEIGLTTSEWGYWFTAFQQLLQHKNVQIAIGQKLPHYWSGPIEVASSDPRHIDKWGYYFDGTTDYILNPYMRDEAVLQYRRDFGPDNIINSIMKDEKEILDITVFNPETFGKSDVSVHVNGRTYTRLKDEPIAAGKYRYRLFQKDISYVQVTSRQEQVSQYTDTVQQREVIKTFFPITVDGTKYVVGVTFDYSGIQQQLFHQLKGYILISLLLLLIVIVIARLFGRSITKPLQTILDTVNKMAAGKLDIRIGSKRRDELGELSNRVDVMAQNLLQFTNELEQSQKTIEFQAYHDPLTNLPNRRFMASFLEAATARAKENGTQVAVLFLDVDRFKVINDLKGHDIGDRLIQALAERLRAAVPDEIVITRQGGDEFIVVIPDVETRDEVARVAEALLAATAEPFQLNGHELSIGISIGISIYKVHSNHIETLIRYADMAMYDAKQKGGNQYVVYESNGSYTAEELALEEKLRKAIQMRKIDVHFQPKLSLHTNKLIGAEALVRWYDEELGFISPAVFIPIAERNGLIMPLWEAVMELVCSWAAAWNRQGYPVPVAVNFSALQFSQSNTLTKRIIDILAEHMLPPELLEMEITESALVTEETVQALWELKDLGITISVDDFGTGYSSLGYLESLPLDIIKIDRSFIRNMAESKKNRRIVEAIIKLAQGLELQVIAEGVETEEQRDYLQAFHCDGMQGYLFSRPLPAEEFFALWQTYQHGKHETLSS